jgi:CheY-like chemotaxis protein
MPVVLIAEDDEDVSVLLARILTRANFTVLSAANGQAAFEMAVAQRPDVVLTDLDMPKLTGLQLCRAIRNHADIRDTPVAMLSGSLQPGDPRAAEAHVCGVLLKPFINAELVAAVKDLAASGPHDHTSDLSACPLAAPVG